MSARRLSEAGLAALSAELGDPGTVERWREKVVTVEGSGCSWWTGAISGRGHGRFYFAPGRAITAYRFAFGLVCGAQVLDQVRVLGHRCVNSLCQRVHPDPHRRRPLRRRFDDPYATTSSARANRWQ